MGNYRILEMWALADECGAFRARQATGNGLHHSLLRTCLIRRIARGLYVSKKRWVSSLVIGQAAVPGGVLCLRSALEFHGLALPDEQAWIAIGPKAWRRRALPDWIRVIYFSGAGWSEGVEDHYIERARIRVYSAAKTIVDCIRRSDLIPRDEAILATRTALERGLCTEEELEALGIRCRCANAVREVLRQLQIEKEERPRASGRARPAQPAHRSRE